ncbi:MAG: hypothetical protein WCH99_01160 [Verrucomicrobiota bacterium]
MPLKLKIHRPWPAIFLLLALALPADGQVSTNKTFIARAEKEFLLAQQSFRSNTNDLVAAQQLARASFELGELLANDIRLAEIARCGIETCRQWLAIASNSAPGHYYLAINLGELAQAQAPSLTAYRLVHEVEREFLAAAALDVHIDYAGPARCLGLLYRDAPGWPLSIGSRRKAREWLVRAAALAPEFPENQLNLAETYLKWRQKEEAGNSLANLAAVWPAAQTNLTGIRWEKDWFDWKQRRVSVQTEFDRIYKAQSSR